MTDWMSQIEELCQKILPSMDDDFNTPKVLAAFHEFRGEVNKLLVKGYRMQPSKRH